MFPSFLFSSALRLNFIPTSLSAPSPSSSRRVGIGVVISLQQFVPATPSSSHCYPAGVLHMGCNLSQTALAWSSPWAAGECLWSIASHHSFLTVRSAELVLALFFSLCIELYHLFPKVLPS